MRHILKKNFFFCLVVRNVLKVQIPRVWRVTRPEDVLDNQGLTFSDDRVLMGGSPSSEAPHNSGRHLGKGPEALRLSARSDFPFDSEG